MARAWRTAPTEWFEADDATIATALQILADEASARRRRRRR